MIESSAMVVMKFGGTSVADQSAIERLIAIVRAQRQADAQQEGGDARGPIVVVSALSKVTDRLLGIAANAGAGDIEGAHNNLRELRQRHTRVVERRSPMRSSASRSSSSSTASSTSSSASCRRSPSCAKCRRAGSTPLPRRARS